MKVLIVGAGIAGPTLAYWLKKTGHLPTLVEQAPELRRGGYVVDFWGTGFDVAEHMGISPWLLGQGYRVKEVREVTRNGRRISHLNPLKVIDGATAGRYVSIARSDLSRIIYDSLGGDVETIFADTVESLEDDGEQVHVGFRSGLVRDFDLVIGADGLHSRVRELIFGPSSQFERSLGITVAAFQLDGYRPRNEDMAITHTTVGAQALRLSLRDDATMFCFTFRNEGPVVLHDITAQQDLLRAAVRDMGWEVPAILERLPEAQPFYMDQASQILMPSWSRGRVALVGDAAACPSLLAGQGSALAMVEAYVLAMALHASGGDHRVAFDQYEHSLSTIVRAKQDAAIGLGSAFAPRSRVGLVFRDAVFGLMGIPLVTRLAVGQSLRDPIELPAPPTEAAV